METITNMSADPVLHFALANLQSGGLVNQPGRAFATSGGDDGLIVDRGHWDFRKLRDMFVDADPTPDIIVVCEAKEWGLWGGFGLRAAAAVLSDLLGRPYVPELGYLPRGLFGPALFYDPNKVHCAYFGDVQETVPDSRVNLAQFHLRGNRAAQFLVMMDHLPFYHGPARLDRTQLLGGWGKADLPLLYCGDLNGVPSGPHWPQRDWSRYRSDWKAAQKGRRNEEGEWEADPEALDRLVGRWVGGPPPEGHRVRGVGWHAIPDLAAAHGEKLLPTTNTTAGGSGLLIDFGIVNEAWRDGYVPGSYYVAVPADGVTPPSDHRRTGWSLTIPSMIPATS